MHGPMRMLCAFLPNYKKTSRHTLLTILSVFVIHFSFAQGTLGRWEACGTSGATASIAPTGVLTNVTFSNLTRGPGINAASANNAFNSTGWSTSTGLNTSNNDYYEFTITPAPGYSISLSAIKIRDQMSNSSFDVFLRSSLDNYATNISNWTASTSASNRPINVSGNSSLQNIGVPVTFRLYGTDASSSSSTYRILCQGTASGNYRGIDIDGTVTQIPYAAQITAINAGAALWCQGETRNVTVTIKNVGSATWNSGDPMNIGLKWNEDTDYGSGPNFIPRVPTGTVTSGQTVVYTFPNVAASTSTGNNNLIADVVREGICWFGNNVGGCGPGNSVFTSSVINVVSTPAAVTVSGAGTFCNSTTITASGGTGGTIYFQGTTSNGTSTATASSSQSVTTSGTYYFRSRSAGGCWGAQGSVAVVINTTPSISAQVQAQSVCVGAAINLSVTATGTPTPTYQWSKDANPIAGATSSTYAIPSAVVGDAGLYSVAISNSCGTVSSSANVVVNSAPVITVDPLGSTVCAGVNASFSVTATGSGLTYQWRKGGVNIGGATSATFNIPSTTVADAGIYDVVVSSAGCASTTSTTALLTVNDLPAANITSTSTAICVGSSTEITGTVTASGAWTLNLSDGQFTNGTGNGSFSFTVSPSSQTTYTLVSLTDANCAAIAAGLTGSTTISANPLPSSVSITPAVATICNGGSTTLTASSVTGETYTGVVNNNFSTGVTAGGTSSGNRSQIFGRENSGSNINSTGTFTSPNGTGMLVALSAASATGFPSAIANSSANTNAILTVSTVGLTSLNLTFNHTYSQANGGGSGTVAVSTNGVDWENVQTYSSNQGGQTNFVAQSFALGNQYLNQANLRIRFTFVATGSSSGFITTAHAYWWAIDDVAINGGLMSLYAWSADTAPAVNGLPGGAGTPGVSNLSVSVNPTTTTTYTLTAINPITSCASTTTSVVNVNERPTAVLTGGAVYCNGDNTTTTLLLTVTGSGTLSGTLSDGTIFSGTAPTISVNVAPSASTTYTIATLQDANCSAITADLSGSADVVVNARPTAAISGGAAYCIGENTTTTLLLTVTGSGTISGTLSDGTPFSGTAPTISVVVEPISTTTYTIATMQDALCSSNASDFSGSVDVVINPLIPVSVSITSSDVDNEICDGESVTFTAASVNGGNASYQWLLNDVPVGANQNTYTTTLANNDVVKVVLTSDVTPCAITNPATSNSIQTVVYPLLPVSVTIASSDVDDTICQGETVVFTATPVNEGSSPVYQWMVNGNPVGANQTTFTTDALMNGDVVTVQLTSNITPCAVNNPAISAGITTVVNALQPVSVTLATDNASACAGTTVFFTATPVNGGDAPIYQWFINDVEVVDSIGATFSSSTLLDNDVVKVILTSNITPCAVLNPATSNSITMNIGEIPGTPGPITGPLNVCEHVNTGIPITYSIDPVVGATSYTWVVPVGATIVSGQGTTSIDVLIDGEFALTNSQFKVQANNDFVCSSPQSKLIVLKIIPAIPTVIFGNTIVCDFVGQPTTVQYSVDPVANATGYNWVVSANMQIVSGQGTTSIEVLFLSAFDRGSVKVAATSNCGMRSQRSLSVSASRPASPDLISGPVNLCELIQESGIATYSIPAVTGATSYTWTLPSGCTLVSGQGTTSIQVSFSSLPSGRMRVRANSNCGVSGERSLDLVATNIYVPSMIDGPTNVCSYLISGANPTGTPVTYTIRKTTAALSYTWTAPANATIISHPNGAGINDTSVVVIFNSSFTEGAISVSSVGVCGVSAPRSLQLSVLKPRAPGAVTVVELGSCPNRTYQYTIPAHANEILWTVPAGGTIVSGQGTTSIVVSYTADVINGQVTAMAVTNCGNSSVRKLTVKLDPCFQTKFVNAPVEDVKNAAFDFTVFPNPFNTIAKVKISASMKEKVEVKIYDATGKLRSTQVSFPGAEVEIGSKLESGVYIIEVNNGKEKITKKVIKL